MTTTAAEALPDAFFLDAEEGQRFCLFHRAQGHQIKGRILYLHPFAEEMNASRHVVAQQCRALAASGYSVLQIDLLGCGDSSGDFGDATWSAWVQDALLGWQWLRDHAPEAPIWLWGLRAGALLACAATRALQAQHPAAQVNLLLWQPMASGQQQLQQFLRLHAAAQWLGRDAVGEPPEKALAAGRHAHVAGYSLSPALAQGLEAARLTPPTTSGRAVLLELPTFTLEAETQTTSVSPWAMRQQSTWRDAGWNIQTLAVPVTGFWQTVVETSLTPKLEQATLAALTEPLPHATSA